MAHVIKTFLQKGRKNRKSEGELTLEYFPLENEGNGIREQLEELVRNKEAWVAASNPS